MARTLFRRTAGIRISRSVAVLVVLLLMVQTSLTYYFFRYYQDEVNEADSERSQSETHLRDALRHIDALHKEIEDRDKEILRLQERLKILDVIEKFAPDMSPEDKTQTSSLIQQQSETYGFSSRLILALILTESTFNAEVVSHKGARGMMQVMPSLQREWNERLDDDEKEALAMDLDDRESLFDPDQNIRLGTAYLFSLVLRFGDVETAIKAYNRGPTEIARRIRQDASLPHLYYQKVQANYDRLAAFFEAPADATETEGETTDAFDQRRHRPDGEG